MLSTTTFFVANVIQLLKQISRSFSDKINSHKSDIRCIKSTDHSLKTGNSMNFSEIKIVSLKRNRNKHILHEMYHKPKHDNTLN